MLRRPLLAVSRAVFSLLKTGPALLRRAVYDAMPGPYLVAGHPEHFVVATADKVIGRELFLHGEFDFAKLQTALAIIEREGLPRPQHLIDVGANIGSIVIPALARGLIQSATAIEPHPTNLRLLRANLALNGLSERVRVLAQAVGAESGASLFLTESSTNSGNHSIGRTGLPSPPPASTTWNARTMARCCGWILRAMRAMPCAVRQTCWLQASPLSANTTLATLKTRVE